MEPDRGPPPIEWQRRIDFPCVAIVPAGGGRHFVVGREPGASLIVATIDSRGEEILRRRYDLPAPWSIVDASPTRDGGCVVVGTTLEGWAEQGADIFLLRIDSGGEAIWKRTFGGPSSEWVKNVIPVPSGGFAIGATTVSRGAGRLDFYLLKVSDSGALEWEETYGAEGWEGEFESAPRVIITRDGGFLLVGSTNSPSLAGERSVEFYAVKTDATGRKLHEWVLGEKESPPMTARKAALTGVDIGINAVEIEDGYILGGTRWNFRPGTVLMKLSDTGQVVWELTRGNAHGDWNLPMLLLPGGKVLAGTGDWDDATSDVAGYLLQVAPDGKLEWEMHGAKSSIGRVMDLEATPDHGVLVLAHELDGERSVLVQLGPEVSERR
jgi:hypothetical protein